MRINDMIEKRVIEKQAERIDKKKQDINSKRHRINFIIKEWEEQALTPKNNNRNNRRKPKTQLIFNESH